MGQRLNIEVCYNGTPIANAYYHWSAYTDSALDLLGKVLTAYKNRAAISSLPVAVEILQATGAGINDEEKQRVSVDETGKFDGISFKDCIDRNEGILAITETGMAETRTWEEGRVTVDIGAEEFLFDVVSILSNEDFEDWYDMSAQQLPDTYFDFTDACKFTEFEKFQKAFRDNPDGVRLDDDTVLCWIE